MAKDTEGVKLPETISDLPNQEIASEAVGQPLDQASNSSASFKALLESPEFEEFIDKKVQSKQDKRLGQYGTKLENLEAAIAQYEAEKGGVVDPKALGKLQGVQREKELLERIMALEGGNVSVPSTGVGEKSWGERQQAILDNAGIDKNDSRIVELLRTSKSKQGFLADLEAKTFEWKQSDVNKPQPSASTVASTIPSVPSGDGSYTVDKYKTDMLAAQGKPDEVKRIKAAARADGVPVDNIAFI